MLHAETFPIAQIPLRVRDSHGQAGSPVQHLVGDARANANRPNSPVTCTRSPNQEVEVATLVPAAQLIYRARATMVLLMMQKWLASAAVSIARQREERATVGRHAVPLCLVPRNRGGRVWSVQCSEERRRSGVEGEDVELHTDEAAGFLTAALSRIYVRAVRTHACR
jgi:hypothetical protein